MQACLCRYEKHNAKNIQAGRRARQSCCCFASEANRNARAQRTAPEKTLESNGTLKTTILYHVSSFQLHSNQRQLASVTNQSKPNACNLRGSSSTTFCRLDQTPLPPRHPSQECQHVVWRLGINIQTLNFCTRCLVATTNLPGSLLCPHG